MLAKAEEKTRLDSLSAEEKALEKAGKKQKQLEEKQAKENKKNIEILERNSRLLAAAGGLVIR